MEGVVYVWRCERCGTCFDLCDMSKNYVSSRDVQLAVKDVLNFHRGHGRAIRRWDRWEALKCGR